MDHYKIEQINEHIKAMDNDEYYMAQLCGPGAKNINLDKGALEVLRAYYSEGDVKGTQIIAQERYEDLCEYFGGSEVILKNRDEFEAWLNRVKWHIRKAEELYEKYEQEPCEDAISRQAVEEKEKVNG